MRIKLEVEISEKLFDKIMDDSYNNTNHEFNLSKIIKGKKAILLNATKDFGIRPMSGYNGIPFKVRGEASGEMTVIVIS